MEEQASNNQHIAGSENQQESVSAPDYAQLEFYKSYLDYIKYLCALSTGSVVLLAAFLEKPLTQANRKLLLAISIICFTGAVVVSMIAFLLTSLSPQYVVMKDRHVRKQMVNLAVVATWGFLLGIVLLAVFALGNFAP